MDEAILPISSNELVSTGLKVFRVLMLSASIVVLYWFQTRSKHREEIEVHYQVVVQSPNIGI